MRKSDAAPKMSALILMSIPRTDYTIIQTWFNLAKYLALTPITIENNPKKTLLYLSKMYPLLLILLFLGATIFSFYQRFYIYQHFNISQAILDALQGLTEILFIEHAVIGSILRKNRWKKLMKSIAQIELRFNWAFNDSIKDSRPNYLKVRIFLYHLVYFAVHIYDSIANWMFVSYALAFVIFRFTTYYIMFSTIFVTFVCTWIKNRYLYLDHSLKVSASARNLKFAILQAETVYEKLTEFSQTYKHLYLIVQETNAVFGSYFFFIAICTVLEILNAVNYGMPTQKQNVANAVTGVNAIFLTLYVICNAQIVMSCDSAGKSAKSIWKTSLILHEQVENKELRGEFLSLANYIQGLSPEFSAAGFWTVNQSVLSTLFSSVMTYIIIIIQFNMTLK